MVYYYVQTNSISINFLIDQNRNKKVILQVARERALTILREITMAGTSYHNRTSSKI